MVRDLLRVVLGVLPPSRVKNFLFRRLGWRVSSSARVMPSVFWRVARLSLGESASIGFGNVFRELDEVQLDDFARVGQWNWVTAAAQFSGVVRTFSIGEHSAVTSRHYLDCSGGLEVGRFTTVAGVRTVVFTHGIDAVANIQSAGSVVIGDYCLVGSTVAITPGTTLGSRSQVGMGAVLHGQLPGGHFYAGVPARPLRASEGAYFARTRGAVD